MFIWVKHIPVVIYNINAMQIKLISCADISENLIWTFMFSSQIPNYSARRHLSLTLFLYFINIYTSDSVWFHMIHFLAFIHECVMCMNIEIASVIFEICIVLSRRLLLARDYSWPVTPAPCRMKTLLRNWLTSTNTVQYTIIHVLLMFLNISALTLCLNRREKRCNKWLTSTFIAL